MMRGMKRPSLFAVAGLAVLLAGAGCQRDTVLRGDLETSDGSPIAGVVDITGHALPGVAVSVRGTDSQAVTDSRGQYRLTAPPGYIEVDYYKTGYTPALMQLELSEEQRTVEMTQAILWPLPAGQGVYFLREGRYRALTRVQPERYLVDGDQSIFASKKGPEMGALMGEVPAIVSFRLPGYDVQLTRVERIEAESPQVEDFVVPVWAPAGRLPTHVRSLDEPRGMLLEVVVDAPLEPGAYAIHWGAFDGHITTESRAFLFEALDPDAVIEAPVTEGEEADTEEVDDSEG